MEKSKLMMITIIVLLVVLLGTIITVSVFALRSLGKGDQVAAREPFVARELSQDQKQTVPLEGSISTELLSTDNTEHVIRITLFMEVDITDKKKSKELIELLGEKEQVVRAHALDIIRSKTFQELKRVDGKSELENEILQKMQTEFNSNLIVNVKASEFVLQ